MVMKRHVVIFWVMTLGGPCCLHFQAARHSEMLVSYHVTKRCQNLAEHDLRHTIKLFLY